MPKTRQTCTRCSQRRQKCDRKAPCTRCVQNSEGHLCTTKWVEGYDPSVHRKYPRKVSSTVSWPSAASSSETGSTLDASPSGPLSTNQPHSAGQGLSSHPLTPIADQNQTHGVSSWPPKIPDISIVALLSEKDQQAQQSLFNQRFTLAQSKGVLRDGPAIASYLSPGARSIEIQYVQSLLPSKTKVIQIVEYYEQYMLYWTGGLYHGPSFRKKLLNAYGSSDTLDLQSLDWRWNALLFSILSSGIIGSSEAMSVSWGFGIDEKVRFAREWGAATVTCLNMGNFMSQYHINSVQAIYVMHAYAHLVGCTNQWIALRTVALLIAKGLGLHRLGPHPDDNRILDLNQEQKEALIEREIGRRTWYAATSQEWLCVTALGSYSVSIQRRSFTSLKPKNFNEETMMPIDDVTPTYTLIGSYFFDYAELFLDFHNAMVDAEGKDDSTRYAMVLKFDSVMRTTAAEKVPKCLSPRVPLDPTWPKWVTWARRLHQASVHHKIIMLHQSFLSKCFKDVRYTYSRWACANAAKNIISTYNTRDFEEPQCWVEQAFVVTAGICLVLELFNRTENDREAQEYQACVQKAISYLQQFFTSSVAIHGARLLISLLLEYNKTLEGSRSNFSHAGTARAFPSVPAMVPDMSVPDVARTNTIHHLPSDIDVPLSHDEATQFNFDIDMLGFEDLMDYLPVEGGLDNNVSFDNITGLANHSS